MKLPPALLGLAALLLASPFVLAQGATALQPSTADVKTALTQVILRQIDALRAGDFPKAYTFAAPEIQAMFPLEAFEKMVRTNYPVLLTEAKVDFGVALDDGQSGVVFVELTGPEGSVIYRYFLKRGATLWKISGVEQTEKVPAKSPLTA